MNIKLEQLEKAVDDAAAYANAYANAANAANAYANAANAANAAALAYAAAKAAWDAADDAFYKASQELEAYKKEHGL